MTEPILSPQDDDKFQTLKKELPHGLIVLGEKGLDVQSTSNALADTSPSHVLIIEPLEGKRDISIEQIRDCIASLRTYASQRRVVIVRLADHLSTPASNSLLKMLEEPPESTHFILESSSLSNLLPTIISRCQILNLHRTLHKQDTLLLQGTKLDNTSKQQILFLAAGRPQLIRDLAKQPQKLDSYREIISDAKKVFTGSAYDKLIAVQKYSTKREEALKLIDIIITLVRFQLKSKGFHQPTIDLLEKTEKAEQLLRANGHVKLSLLQIVI